MSQDPDIRRLLYRSLLYMGSEYSLSYSKVLSKLILIVLHTFKLPSFLLPGLAICTLLV